LHDLAGRGPLGGIVGHALAQERDQRLGQPATSGMGSANSSIRRGCPAAGAAASAAAAPESSA
jgi:hypothetical protein